MRMRRPRSHRLGLLEPCSIACDPNTASTVPRWYGDKSTALALETAQRDARCGSVVEEPVHRWTAAADVGAERTALVQTLGDRRRGEVVRRQRGEVARTADVRDRGAQSGCPLVEAGCTVPRVERGVDVGG